MKKKHIGITICAVLVVVSAVVILAAVLRRNSGKETGTQDVPPTVTLVPTTQPTAVPTTEPTNIPVTVEPTKEPIIEPTIAPTLEPTKVPTSTPVPTATSTPIPEPSPTLTPTPIPTEAPVAKEDTMMIGEYEIPATRTVNGKEYPWFYEDEEVLRAEKVGENTYLAVFKDKKDSSNFMIFDVSNGDCMYWEIKDSALETASVSELLGYAKAHTNTENILEKLSVAPSLMPTPTPTPTPFPTPNPEQPKKLGSSKGDKNYGNTVVEAWDNGYAYINGTGEYHSTGNMYYCPEDAIELSSVIKASKFTLTHLIIEEGVTGLADGIPPLSNGSSNIRDNLVYVEFPLSFKTMKKYVPDSYFDHDVTITGYKNGEKITFILRTGDNWYDALKAKLDIEIK